MSFKQLDMCALQRNNRVGEKGAVALAEVLKSNSSIQILDLVSSYFRAVSSSCISGVDCGAQGYNRLGDAGADALGEGLKLNRSLTELNLVSCDGIGLWCYIKMCMKGFGVF